MASKLEAVKSRLLNKSFSDPKFLADLLVYSGAFIGQMMWLLIAVSTAFLIPMVVVEEIMVVII